MQSKRWLMTYGVAVAMAALFAAILGQVPLFRGTLIGKFRAASLVQFIGYGAALITILLGARQIAVDRSDDWKWLGPFRHMMVPASTLLVLGLGYEVVLLVLRPLLDKGGKVVYNWTFVIAIIAASSWVIVTWVQKCAPQLSDSRSDDKEHKRAA